MTRTLFVLPVLMALNLFPNDLITAATPASAEVPSCVEPAGAFPRRRTECVSRSVLRTSSVSTAFMRTPPGDVGRGVGEQQTHDAQRRSPPRRSRFSQEKRNRRNTWITGAQLAIRLLPNDPILIAHRGLLRHAPENTLPAFAGCLELGFGFELDIRTTKDGRLVVLHEDTLAHTTDGPDRSVRRFTLSELKTFDAGSWFHPRFAGERVPTLEETFALIRQRRRGRTIIALNIKDITRGGEKRLVELIEKYDLFSDTFAFDQSDECSRRLKALNPQMRIGANVSRNTFEMRLKEGLLDVFLVTFIPLPEEVQRLHQHDRQVVFNFAGSGDVRRNPAAWDRARQAGIDGLLTDFPLECQRHWQDEKEGRSRK